MNGKHQNGMDATAILRYGAVGPHGAHAILRTSLSEPENAATINQEHAKELYGVNVQMEK